MTKVNFFIPSQDYIHRVENSFEKHREKILCLIPSAKIEHVGGTSIPGLLTKGDLDLQVSVIQQEFARAIVLIRSEYINHQIENWTKSYASFKHEDEFDIAVGIQLVVENSESDIFVKSRDLLLTHPEKIEELNQLKRSYEGKDMDTYIENKGEFFTLLLNIYI
jgi:GrpB-like predicted nucleotidyltransferase (UPF0157 family)